MFLYKCIDTVHVCLSGMAWSNNEMIIIKLSMYLLNTRIFFFILTHVLMIRGWNIIGHVIGLSNGQVLIMPVLTILTVFINAEVVKFCGCLIARIEILLIKCIERLRTMYLATTRLLSTKFYSKIISFSEILKWKKTCLVILVLKN
jgi:hypothetical protein